MTGGEISLELRNRLSELERLEQSLEQFGAALGLSKKTLFEITLAVEELVTNIISYGYTDDADHWIKITISLENEIVTMRLEDEGIPFDPSAAKDPDCQCPVEQRKIGNLGIHLTKRLVDEMTYERCGKKNILTLKKRLHKHEVFNQKL